MSQRTTSDKGIAFNESHEGVVLKAYRCPAGILTIGSGLTAASGVIVPKPGMTISRIEARALLGQALRRNYEPAVNAAMPDAKQNEFDAGVSFHFNTGAIKRASWVKAWKNGDRPGVLKGLRQWVKGGGKVLPGLKRRREEEAAIILYDKWPATLRVTETPDPDDGFAVIVISLSSAELIQIREGFRKVGFDPGLDAGKVSRLAVEDFQRRYDLTMDGKIGRATLATLQRELDARAGAAKGSGTVVVGGGGAAGGGVVAPDPSAGPDLSLVPSEWLVSASAGVAVLGSIYLAYLAWHYRDMIAARVADRAPRLAAWLRSF